MSIATVLATADTHNLIIDLVEVGLVVLVVYVLIAYVAKRADIAGTVAAVLAAVGCLLVLADHF